MMHNTYFHIMHSTFYNTVVHLIPIGKFMIENIKDFWIHIKK